MASGRCKELGIWGRFKSRGCPGDRKFDEVACGCWKPQHQEPMVLRAVTFEASDKAPWCNGAERVDQESSVSEHLSWDCDGLKTTGPSFGGHNINPQIL